MSVISVMTVSGMTRADAILTLLTLKSVPNQSTGFNVMWIRRRAVASPARLNRSIVRHV